MTEQLPMPSPGTLSVYRLPKGPGIRVDDGVEQGSVISSLYDPMIAKLIVRGHDREAAINRSLAALAEYEVEGIRTNLALLDFVLRSESFASGRYHTGILGELGELPRPEPTAEEEKLARVLAVLALRDNGSAERGQAASDGSGSRRSNWAIFGLKRQLGSRLI